MTQFVREITIHDFEFKLSHKYIVSRYVCPQNIVNSTGFERSSGGSALIRMDGFPERNSAHIDFSSEELRYSSDGPTGIFP